MREIIKWLLLISSMVVMCHGTMQVTEDAIIVEAEQQATEQNRHQRQIFFAHQSKIPFGANTEFKSGLSEGNACLTSKGHLGYCTSFRSCYPYFKIPDLSIWESWVLGNYDSCSYFNGDGRQAYGVCCTNPVTDMPPLSSEQGETIKPTLSNKIPYPGNVYPAWQQGPPQQWPPAIITHPPDHTAATHPTPSSDSSTSTTTARPTTTWATKHTTRPPYHSTTSTSTTESPSANFPTSSTCGVKNVRSSGFWDQGKIVGGVDAVVQEWPWIVALFNAGRQFCGGSLIDESHILTAAHCVAHMSSWDVARLRARLGDHNIKIDSEVMHYEQKVKRVVRHRGFDSRTLHHDIAVLTLEFPMKMSRTVSPICLPKSSQAYNGYMATVIGWGSLRENGAQPAILQKVSIPVWSNAMCRQKYGQAAPGGITDGMLCAGQASMDSCSGDSGGPLMVQEGSTWVQAGVVSWGIGCGKGQYPGVYARVTHYLPWIMKNIKEH